MATGFGFRGTTNQGLANVYDTFWIGEAVHFNNAIYSGTGAASWNLVITLQVTVNGNTVTQNFNYALNIDETPNRCDTNDGCPWTSSWWSANPTADTRSDCSSSSSTLPSGLKCCRFFTVNNNPCSDRLFTTDALDQTTSIVIAGRPYALNVRGFTVPGDVTTQRSYFISQERGNSKAELYANLVDACPAISSCPPGTDLVIVGTACVCQCPATATCPSSTYQRAPTRRVTNLCVQTRPSTRPAAAFASPMRSIATAAPLPKAVPLAAATARPSHAPAARSSTRLPTALACAPLVSATAAPSATRTTTHARALAPPAQWPAWSTTTAATVHVRFCTNAQSQTLLTPCRPHQRKDRV